MEQLIDYFKSLCSLSNKEIDFIQAHFIKTTINRRDYFLREGDVSKVNTFVAKGCLRKYIVDENGKEHNIQFAIENWWIGDINSFHNKTPSIFNIKALEETTLFQIKKNDQIKMFTEHPKFNQIFRTLAERAMIGMQQRIAQNISSTAKERYLDFLENQPQLLNRISNAQIASYLGITPEFLSIIRKEIIQN